MFSGSVLSSRPTNRRRNESANKLKEGEESKLVSKKTFSRHECLLRGFSVHTITLQERKCAAPKRRSAPLGTRLSSRWLQS